MIYANNNEILKAEKLLSESLELIHKNNSHDMIEYINNLTHYARQINDRQLLNKSYELIEDNNLKLKHHEQFALEISELRMRYNDNYDFEEYYQNMIIKVKEKKDTLNIEEKLLVIREFMHILQQYIRTKKDAKTKLNDLKWIVEWHLSLKQDIEYKLNEIESSLSDVKVYWLQQLISLERSKQIFSKEDYLPILHNIINYSDEIINIWRDSQNDIKHISVLINVIDEINHLFLQTRDKRLIDCFKDKITIYLSNADKLLEKNWHKPDTGYFMIGIAYFSVQIKDDKQIATKWINRFDNLNFSLNHYAEFIKREYQDVKNYLKKVNM